MTFPITAADCVNWKDFVAKKGGAKRLAWRPPRDFYVKSGGDLISDARGLFTKYLGHKVVFKNRSNVALRVKATVPVGKLANPGFIYARPVVTDLQCDPQGSKKEMSRVKGKGKNKVDKPYDKATDRIEFSVTESKLFRGDANLFSLFVDKMAVTDNLPHTANVFALLDFALLLPNDSQYTGQPFAADQVMMDVIIKVRYIISRLEPSPESKSVYDPMSFTCGPLGSFDAMYHVDADQFYASVNNATTHVIKVKDYPYIGIKNIQNQAVLCYMDKNSNFGPPARLAKLFEVEGTRMNIGGVSLKDDTSNLNFTNFVYDDESKCWAVSKSGRIIEVEDKRLDRTQIDSSVPITVHSWESTGLAHSGLVRYYEGANSYAISWNIIAAGLSTVVKVINFAIGIGNSIFG